MTMTPEELKEAKERRAMWLEEIKNKQNWIEKLHQRLFKAEDDLHAAKGNYHMYDRKIAMEEHYTLCPPAGRKS